MGRAGTLFQNNLDLRRRELGNLYYALGLLKTELSYADAFLGESFMHIGNRTGGEIGKLFSEAGTKICSDSGCRGLLLALTESKQRLPFAENEYEIIEKLGEELGTRDLKSELRRIEYAAKATETSLTLATERQKKWGRVYGTGGWLCGLTAALFFL